MQIKIAINIAVANLTATRNYCMHNCAQLFYKTNNRFLH